MLAVAAIACGPDEYGLAQAVAASCATESTDGRFFNGVLRADFPTKEARTQGFAESLERFNLPPLACGGDIDEAYRIVYAPQQAESLILSAVRNGAERQLTSLRIRNSDKTLLKSDTGSLDQDQWLQLVNAFAEFNFWSRTSYPSAAGSTHTVSMVHGSAWIVEARQEGRYHALSRVSNAREGDFDGVAKVFFRLASLEVPGEFRTSQY